MHHNLPEGDWLKSSYSGNQQGACIEYQPTPDNLIAIGDSKARTRGAFVFTPGTWTAFLRAVRHDKFGELRT